MKNLCLHLRINLRSIKKEYIPGWQLSDDYKWAGYRKSDMINLEKQSLKN